MTAQVRTQKRRRELYVNTVAAWGWAQGALVASVLALPLLTRFLPKAEFGLWTQMLSLSALATVADFGMSSAFLRRLASGTEPSNASVLRAASKFYRISSLALAATLLTICFVPQGVLAPFVGKTRLPQLTAVVIIVAIVVNLWIQPYALRVLAQGRLDLERTFGTGVALVGTLATVAAAYWFGTALAVGLTYAAAEVGFDVAFVLMVRRSRTFNFAHQVDRPASSVAWWPIVSESSGILVIELVPQLTLVVDAVIVGHIEGPVAVAIYGVALRVADFVRRFFSPFTESLFVSLCRTTGADRSAVEAHASSLPWLIVTSALAVGCAVAALGGHTLALVFGKGYRHGEVAVLVLLAAAMLRGMYMPGVRRVQADAALGSLPRWFVVGLVAHVAAAILLTVEWSITGTAIAVLVAVAVFEAWPATAAVSRHLHNMITFRDIAVAQFGAAALGGALLLFLTWWRVTLGGWSAVVCGILALAFGVVALGQVLSYLRSSRVVVVDV